MRLARRSLLISTEKGAATFEKGAARHGGRPYRPLREPGGRPRGAMVSGPPGRAGEKEERFIERTPLDGAEYLAALEMTNFG